MQDRTEKKSIFVSIKYLFNFIRFLVQERVFNPRKLNFPFQKIQQKSKIKKSISPLLVLFDTKSMPIEEYYNLTRKAVIEKFGQKDWDNAILDIAYPNYYHHNGYPYRDSKYQEIKRDENVVCSKEHTTPYVIIVSHDQELISHSQNIIVKYSLGRCFVYNGIFLKE